MSLFDKHQWQQYSRAGVKTPVNYFDSNLRLAVTGLSYAVARPLFHHGTGTTAEQVGFPLARPIGSSSVDAHAAKRAQAATQSPYSGPPCEAGLDALWHAAHLVAPTR